MELTKHGQPDYGGDPHDRKSDGDGNDAYPSEVEVLLSRPSLEALAHRAIHPREDKHELQ